MQYFELNLDGLVGPTHHYAGLSSGNVASIKNAFKPANPQAAALQGLEKMRLLHQLGIKQAVLPPHQRPHLPLLERLGFSGTDEQKITQAAKVAPQLLSACYSASSMWTANAATVSPSCDTADQRVHFTAANLVNNLHRHQEANFSQFLLEKLFASPKHFQHHPCLPSTSAMGDEGAANHNRLCASYGKAGINLFIYGKHAITTAHTQVPAHYPARQTFEASQTIARMHQLNPDKTLFAQQTPAAIDAGVFHNDVIALANERVFLVHEAAYLDQAQVLNELRKQADFPLSIIEISAQQLSLAEAVSSYLFNSQLVTLPNGNMVLISPKECEVNAKVKAVIDSILADTSNPISQVYYLDLKQSMQNGGGPACLRLRVPLNSAELAAMHQGVIITDDRLDQLEVWVKRHYRTQLAIDDLADPAFSRESLNALDELTALLDLGALYPFQR